MRASISSISASVLDATGIGYASFCLTGITGKDRGTENAQATVGVCNRPNP